MNYVITPLRVALFTFAFQAAAAEQQKSEETPKIFYMKVSFTNGETNYYVVPNICPVAAGAGIRPIRKIAGLFFGFNQGFSFSDQPIADVRSINFQHDGSGVVTIENKKGEKKEYRNPQDKDLTGYIEFKVMDDRIRFHCDFVTSGNRMQANPWGWETSGSRRWREKLVVSLEMLEQPEYERLAALKDAETARLLKEKSRQEAAANAERERGFASFRVKLAEGSQTHCGMVVGVKPKIVQVQTQIGDKWFQREQLYPQGEHACRFTNGTYVD